MTGYVVKMVYCSMSPAKFLDPAGMTSELRGEGQHFTDFAGD